AVGVAAGFRETGGEGVRREADLRAWLRGQSMRILGPNCLGWIRPACRLNVTFAPGMPEPGNIAFVSHSGALAVAILDWARERRMGFSLFASLGNQADIIEADVLAEVARDVETQVIVGYLEGDGRGPPLLRDAARRGRAEARDRAQGGPLRRGRARRVLAHRSAGRLGHGVRCCGEAGRRGQGRNGGRAVRPGARAGEPALAPRPTTPRRDEWGRTRHRVHGCGPRGWTRCCAARPSSARPPRRG